MKTIFSAFLLSCLFLGTFNQNVCANDTAFKIEAKFYHKSTTILVFKNKLFTGTDLECLFMILCEDSKLKNNRTFFIKKTNLQLRSKTLSEFAFIEKISSSDLIYPFGWETSKISNNELKENCILILENKIKPL